MYLGVLFLPLLSSVIVGFAGRFLGRKGSSILSTLLVGFTFLLSSFIFYEVGVCGDVSVIKVLDWFTVGSLFVTWGFLFDSVTATMLVVITSISFLVHLYSTSYMEEDPHIVRFMSYLSLFTFFMICMVVSHNYVQLFLGWEGVGVTSYLLINFWFTRVEANKAAIKAIVVNRFGDFGVLLGLLCLFYIFRSLNFGVIFNLVDLFSTYYISFYIWEVHAITLAVVFLFIGCVGKSAQLGLHTWLPDAMEGPTPVSALIHAATMVTAGVFLLIRSSILLEYSSDALVLICTLGAITAFFAGTVGIFQNDLKRVIAYSTCSQLGYMVFACGLSNYNVALFHLTNHAFFKALLFLSAGSVIHAVSDEQDMRRLGGLIKLLPLTFSTFMIGSLALMGFPYTTGYYSKDLILELSYSNYYVEGIFSYWLGVLAAGCTAFYSVRLLYLTFIAETNSFRAVIKGVHDAPVRMALPLIILSFGSIFVGYILHDMFIGVGTTFWGNSIGYYNIHGDVLMLEAEFLPAYIKLFPVLFSLFFAFVAFILYNQFASNLYLGGSSFGRKVYSFFNKKWYFDGVYNYFIVKKVLAFGYNTTFKVIDRGLVELVGPTGLVRLLGNSSNFISKINTGFIYHYVLIMVLSMISIIYFMNYLVVLSSYFYSDFFLVLLVVYFYIAYGNTEKNSK